MRWTAYFYGFVNRSFVNYRNKLHWHEAVTHFWLFYVEVARLIFFFSLAYQKRHASSTEFL